MNCPSCGKELLQNAAFCTSCGMPVRPSDIVVPDAPVPTPPKAPAAPIAPAAPKQGLDMRAQFALSAVIGLVMFLLVGFVMRFFLAKYGAMSVITLDRTRSTMLWAAFGVLLVAGIIYFAVFGKKPDTKAPLVTALILGILTLMSFFVFSNVFVRLIDRLLGIPSFYLDTFLSAAGFAGLFSLIPAALICFLVKKRSLRSDAVIYAIVFVVVLLLSFAMSLLGVPMFYMGLPFGLAWPFVVLVPCSRALSSARAASAPAAVRAPAPAAAETFCPNCGMHFPAGQGFCNRCGTPLRPFTQAANAGVPVRSASADPLDAPSGGFAALGFFFPVVGLILYCVWRDNFPLRARSAGKGALAGTITWIGLIILIYLIYFIFLFSLLY